MNQYQIKNILAPVDLSDTSLNAIETAVALAKKHDASLHLLYVVEKKLNPTDAGLDLYISHINTDVLSAIASAIRHHHELVPTVSEVEGNVTECIVTAAAQMPADLIVIGTHGASGARDGFIGTNAYNTIKHSTCPVLTVPPGRKFTAFKKLLFPVRPVSGALTNFATVDCFLSPTTMVDVFGVSYTSDAQTNLLEKLIEETRDREHWAGATTRTFWGSLSNAPEAILQHAVKSKPDLLILTSTLDPVAKPDYVGPHAQKIIHSARVPVLVIKKASVPLLV